MKFILMNPDGSNVTRLTDNDSQDGSPAWSPDGRQIVFSSKPAKSDSHNTEIIVMNADGSNPVRLVDIEAGGSNPDWSPDGNRIAFMSKQTGKPNIFVMDRTGGDIAQLTDNRGEFTAMLSLTWSPDGRSIAFSGFRDGIWDIFIMDADGENVRRLTANGLLNGRPDW